MFLMLREVIEVTLFFFQVCAEYQRITNQQLRLELYASLDQHTDRLLAIASEMQGKSGLCAQKTLR